MAHVGFRSWGNAATTSRRQYARKSHPNENPTTLGHAASPPPQGRKGHARVPTAHPTARDAG